MEDMPWFWEAKDFPIAETNWYRLYCEVKTCSSTLKGLRNRKRIWRDVEEFVRRIDQYRADGKIGEEATVAQ